MNTYTKPLALATTILLSASFSAPANAEQPVDPVSQVTSELPKIEAPLAKLSYDHPVIKTSPAPAPAPVQEAAPAPTPEPAPVQEAPVEVAYAPEPAPASTPTLPTPQTTTPAVAPQAAKVSAPVAAPKAPPAAAASGKGATIAAAAYAQIGVAQDCTRLASNALAAAGINFHGWPAGYLSLGRTVSAAEARPGDLAYYQDGGMGLAHIAVYVGNGQAVHGGWNGGTTALFSVNVGSGPVFIRVA